MDATSPAIEQPVHFIKYMGSKSKIIDQVVDAILAVERAGEICDLFAGSCTLAGVLGHYHPIVSNDIQHYSAALARAYLMDWRGEADRVTVARVVNGARRFFDRHYAELVEQYQYEKGMSLSRFQKVDKENLSLIDSECFDNKWHLFVKYYSGTWWSAEQCAWIDSLRQQIEKYADSSYYSSMLASLMFAMAYTSQGTGHYAQYRDAKTESARKDIEIYRTRDLLPYFERKLSEVFSSLPTEPPALKHRITSLDYVDCMRSVSESTVYADPPYCFVHYSRFYHALETIVLYDYPELQIKGGKLVKGRYREGRHQSPFCIRTQVADSFRKLFELVDANDNSLVLSYSNTGMIGLDELVKIAHETLPGYDITSRRIAHSHMTMGRRNDRHRDVNEMLITMRLK